MFYSIQVLLHFKSWYPLNLEYIYGFYERCNHLQVGQRALCLLRVLLLVGGVRLV